jgi:hypothetical protein
MAAPDQLSFWPRVADGSRMAVCSSAYNDVVSAFRRTWIQAGSGAGKPHPACRARVGAAAGCFGLSGAGRASCSPDGICSAKISAGHHQAWLVAHLATVGEAAAALAVVIVSMCGMCPFRAAWV